MGKYKVKMTATGAEIFLYDDVTSWACEDLVKEMARIPAGTAITLRINSGGGEVFAAVAIYNAIRRRASDVTAVVEGLAASSASYIAMAAGRILMPSNAFLMIHNPISFVSGGPETLESVARHAYALRDMVRSAYAERSGRKMEDIAQMMDVETWMTAQEAVDAGFADEVIDGVQIAASAYLAQVASSYARAPRVLMQALGPADDAGDPGADVAPVDPSGTAPAAPSDAAEGEGDPADGDADEEVEADAGDEDLTPEQRQAVEISETCALAGRPEMIAGFLRGKATPAQVRAALMAAAPTDASGRRGKRTAPRAVDYAGIAEMCLLVGRPEAAAGYIKAGASLDTVRADLLAQRVMAAGGDIDPTHTGVQTPHSADDRRRMDGEKPRIDARKIIAGHNARASKWRR